MKTVFCDESGFDGNNLWHPDQPYFSYAAVCIAPDEADAIIAEAMQRFKPPGNEIKTAKLLRSNPGRKLSNGYLSRFQEITKSFVVTSDIVWQQKCSST